MQEIHHIERVILNSLITSKNGLVKKVRSFGGQTLFRNLINKKVYESIEEMYLNGVQIDFVTLANYIVSQNKFYGTTQEDPVLTIGSFAVEDTTEYIDPLLNTLLEYAERDVSV